MHKTSGDCILGKRDQSIFPPLLTNSLKKRIKENKKITTEMCLACCRRLFLPILNDRRSSLSHHSLAHVNWLYVKEIAYGELLLPAFCFGTEQHTAVLVI